MIRLAEEFFDMKNDPEQISVDGESMAKLKEIHPATMSEEKDENGPIAWILVIPTAHALMEAFIQGEINERELLDRTLPGRAYDALYLCSALILPEHRGKGLARRLTSRAIGAIRHDHPLRSLFYWSFSAGGDSLAASVARECGLPLYRRQSAPPSLI
jgi:GNAT superfamily N-acetyltransferase